MNKRKLLVFLCIFVLSIFACSFSLAANGKSIMKGEEKANADSGDDPIFGNTSINVKRNQITKITLKTNIDNPTGYSDENCIKFDISLSGDSSVMVWLVPSGDSQYEMTIGGNEGIIASKSAFLFQSYTQCKEINGLNNLQYTDDCTDFSQMFANNISLKRFGDGLADVSTCVALLARSPADPKPWIESRVPEVGTHRTHHRKNLKNFCNAS